MARPATSRVLDEFSSQANSILEGVRAGAQDAHQKLGELKKQLTAGLEGCRDEEAAASEQLSARLLKFEEQCRVAAQQNAIQQNTVTLSVGGQHFTTSLTTLRREANSMLGIMFSGNHALTKMEDGSIFIDRDPTHFRYVLNFLRDGPTSLPPRQVAPTPAVDGLRRELLAEARFFQLQGMMAALEDGAAARIERCRVVGGEIKAAEDAVRAGLQSADAATVAQAVLEAEALLLDVFSPAQQPTFLSRTDEPLPADCALVLGVARRGCRVLRKKHDASTRSIVPSLGEFASNWRVLTLGAFAGFQWDGVVAAGGSVLGCLLPMPSWATTSDEARMVYLTKAAADNDTYQVTIGDVSLSGSFGGSGDYIAVDSHDLRAAAKSGSLPNSKSGFEDSDIDLFLYGLDEAAALAKIRHIHEVLKAQWQQQVLVVRSETSITFASGWPRRRVQVILRLYRSVAEVLVGFDIDACCVAYDGTRVWASKRARRAINCSYNLVDPTRRSPTFEMRLYKYSTRGFAVAVPAFEHERVSSRFLTTPPDQTEGLARLLLYAHHEQVRLPRTSRQAYEYHDVSGLMRHMGLLGSTMGSKNNTCDYNPPGIQNLLIFAPHIDWCELIERVNDHLSMTAWQQPKPTIRFVIAHDLDRVLQWQHDEVVRPVTANGGVFMGRAGLSTAVFGPLTFIRHDPGRQYLTGSFHPDDRDWFAMAYGEQAE